MVYVDQNGNRLSSVDLNAGYLVDKEWIDHPEQTQKGHYVYMRNDKGGIVQTYVIDQEARGAWREVTEQMYITFSAETETCRDGDGGRVLRFVVTKQNIDRDPGCDFTGLVPGSEGYLRAKFEFDGAWDGCNKAASFFDASGTEHAEAVIGGECEIPKEATAGSYFLVSATGAKTGYKIKTGKVTVKQGG